MESWEEVKDELQEAMNETSNRDKANTIVDNAVILGDPLYALASNIFAKFRAEGTYTNSKEEAKEALSAAAMFIAEYKKFLI